MPVPRIELIPTPKWVRACFAGEFIADSTHARLLREAGRPPVYYFPHEDVRTELLLASDYVTQCPHKGEAQYWHLRVGEREARNAAWTYPESGPRVPDLDGYIGLVWDAMDAWFEEDEAIHVHPRDPYVRIDTALSSRHVEAWLGGIVVARSTRPVLLFETGLPVRFYLPKLDVRRDLLRPSARVTRCPYKGETRYWSARVGGRLYEDVAWCYPYPRPEVAAIADRICFHQERLEAFKVDGRLTG